MNKDEKIASTKDLKAKEVQNKAIKYNKISKKNIQENSMKDISKSFKKKYLNKCNNKELIKSHKQLKGTDKLSKNMDQNNKHLNRIDITMNFNLTNFTTYNDTNKTADKKLIENYSGKKGIMHKRQISDGFQKIKVINTSNYVNIKVNTKGNRTSTNKEINDIKKMNNKSKIFNNYYINYDDIEENERINKTNNYIYNSHKDLYSNDKMSNLNINMPNYSNNKKYNKKGKTFNLININNIETTNSVLNLKGENEKTQKNQTDKNILAKKIMINNKLFRYKTFKNSMAESKKVVKTETSKKSLLENAIKERMKEYKKLKQTKNYNIIFADNKIKIVPSTSNKNMNKKINKSKSNISVDGLNNIKGQNLYKNAPAKIDNTSRNNTNRESIIFMSDKKIINEEENDIMQSKDENNPEIIFFNIVKLIQKSKNSVA